jgi:hypothetical protein
MRFEADPYRLLVLAIRQADINDAVEHGHGHSLTGSHRRGHHLGGQIADHMGPVGVAAPQLLP